MEDALELSRQARGGALDVRFGEWGSIQHREELLLVVLGDSGVGFAPQCQAPCGAGKQMRRVFINALYATLYVKPEGRLEVDYFVEEHPQDRWIYFPWELQSGFDKDKFEIYP